MIRTVLQAWFEHGSLQWLGTLDLLAVDGLEALFPSMGL